MLASVSVTGALPDIDEVKPICTLLAAGKRGLT